LKHLKGKARKRLKRHLLEIKVELYRMTVLVAWEVPLLDVLLHAKDAGCAISKKRAGEMIVFAKNCAGLTSHLGDRNTDIVIWLKKRPTDLGTYGALYHELFHAVDYITKSHNLDGEIECRAFLMEYLATKCNRYFWAKQKGGR